VILKTDGGHQLAIPKEAVIDDGDRQYAIVALANGYFDPREIKVGPPANEYFPLISGLEMGERIVTSAQFLVDSETNLQTVMKAMAMSMPGMDMGGGDMPGGGTAKTPEKPDDSMKGMDMKDDPMKGMDMKPAKPKGHDEHRQ
jgi:Cu(I)/Ag(I) efflux system membrane fusion protein